MSLKYRNLEADVISMKKKVKCCTVNRDEYSKQNINKKCLSF